jgi:hypothetical protein
MIQSLLKDGVDGSSKSVVRWLSRIRRKWLLVLDNADGDFEALTFLAANEAIFSLPAGIQINSYSRNPTPVEKFQRWRAQTLVRCSEKLPILATLKWTRLKQKCNRL